MKQPKLMKVNCIMVRKNGELVDFEALPLEERRQYIIDRHVDYFTSRAAREGYKILSIEPVYKKTME